MIATIINAPSLKSTEALAMVASRRFYLAMLLLLAPTCARAQTPNFVLQWGSAGSGPGQFSNPSGIAVDALGFVYVTDQYNHRVEKFTPDGVFVLMWGSLGRDPQQFEIPWDLAADASGNIFVVDNRPRVQEFTSDGVFVRQWDTPLTIQGTLAQPTDIAVDRRGMVYVTEKSGIVDEFSPSGEFIRSIGGGVVAGESVVVDADGNIFVGETGSLDIAKMGPAGSLLLRWGGPGTGDGQFNAPVGLALDRFGNVYEADYRNYRIQVFTNSGQFVGKWGTEGTGPGEFLQPVHLAVAPGGAIYVVDLLGNRIEKFDELSTPVKRTTWGAIKAAYR